MKRRDFLTGLLLTITAGSTQAAPCRPGQRNVGDWNRRKLYPGFPHGMLTTYSETINKDLLEFIKG
jgi:hypothetical protein